MLRKMYLFLLILVLALAFTACGADERRDVQEPVIEQEAAEEAADMEDETVAVEEDAEIVEDTAAAETETTDEMVAEEEVIPLTGGVDVNRLSTLIDLDVYNSNNEDLGDIEAAIIDFNKSEIKYLVVEVGGFLGMGEKSVAVPYQAFSLNQPLAAESETEEMIEQTPNSFLLDVAVETLENAPEIDLSLLENPLDPEAQQAGEAITFEEQEQGFFTFWQNELDLMNDEADPTTITETSEMTDTTAADITMQASSSNYGLADELLEASLFDATGTMEDSIDNVEEGMDDADEMVDDAEAVAEIEDRDELGNVEDVAVDAATGKIKYVVVELNDEVIGEQAEAQVDGDPLTPIPLSQLHWNAHQETLSYTGNQPIQDLRTITSEAFQNPDMDWDLDIEAFWDEMMQEIDENLTD